MSLRRAGKVIILAGLLAGVAALAWLAVVSSREKSGSRFILASGVAVRVLGTTYGTQHHRPGWGRVLPPPVRTFLERLFGGRSPGQNFFTTTRPALVVWLSHNATNAAAPADSVTLAVADEAGSFAGDSDTVTIFGGNPGVVISSFEALPRRLNKLRLLAFEMAPNGRHRRVADVAFPNPARGKFPDWPAQSLPCSQTNDDLVCTLLSVKTGFGISASSAAVADGSISVRYSRAEDDGQNRAAASLVFNDPAAPSNAWEIAAVHVADAGGNSLTNSSLGNSVEFGRREQRCVFGPSIWPSETWRLELVASRKAESGFTPEELAIFTNVPLPEIGATGRIERVVSVGATAITLKSVERREPLPENNRGWSSGQLSEVRLAVAGLPADAKFTLVSASDEAGRKLDSPSSSWGHSEPHDASFGFVRIHAEARALNLVFAVHPTRRFTFFVRPELASTNDLIPAGP